MLELLHGFGEDFLVHVEAQFRDETALFAPEEVAGSPNVEVAHGDLDTAAEVAELRNRLEAFAAFVRQQTKRWRQEVAEGFFVRAPDAATELVQVT